MFPIRVEEEENRAERRGVVAERKKLEKSNLKPNFELSFAYTTKISACTSAIRTPGHTASQPATHTKYNADRSSTEESAVIFCSLSIFLSLFYFIFRLTLLVGALVRVWLSVCVSK